MLKLLNKWTLERFHASLGASPIIATASLPPWSASLTFRFTSMCMKLLWGSWRAGLGVIMDTFHKFALKLICVYLSITSIQARNRDMIQARSYRGMQTRNPLTVTIFTFTFTFPTVPIFRHWLISRMTRSMTRSLIYRVAATLWLRPPLTHYCIMTHPEQYINPSITSVNGS